ncbi:MAG: hypothetical protein FD189_1027 [Elusimicrobia bacterium]|nr:MAG: hypothetical protein FD154_1268 [Elusimicrobiota bacterium]KAF0156474.1 MAG: hypothetical protein FD189_1027 [Elusimicrobiota bacterium]
MKKLIAILALIALTGNIAGAELLKNFKYDGKVEVNSWQKRNTDFNKTVNDKRNDTDVRVQVNMGFDLNDDVDAVVSLVKNNRQYGAGNERIGNIESNPVPPTAGSTGILGQLVVEQAYMNLKGVFGMDHKLGRQYYGNEGDLVVYYGPQSWPYKVDHIAQTNQLSVAATDGWTGWYKADKLNLHALMFRAAQGQAAADTDTHIWGVVAGYDLADDIKLGGYHYRQDRQSGVAAGPDTTLGVIGAKVNAKFYGFTYGVELAKNVGTYNENVSDAGLMTGIATKGDFTGRGMKFNAGYEMDVIGKLAFNGEFARGTGDTITTDNEVKSFQSINGDYRPGIIWGGGHLPVGGEGIANLKTWNIGAKWNPEAMEKLTLKAKLFSFSPTKKLLGTAKAYDAYGSEFNLCANWQHSEDVGVKAYYATFMPDDDFATRNSTIARDDATSVLGAAFNVKF